MSKPYQKVASFEATKDECDHVLLLYSGGLDTSVMLKWIQEEYDCDITTLTIDIGQQADFEAIKQKALNFGAKEAIVVDAKKAFAEEVLTTAIKANATYQNGYHLFCPLGRVTISKTAVQVAHQKGLKVIAHGCTGKGNDQVRFESYITTLDSELKTIAPVREWALGRDELIAYAQKNNIPIPHSVDSPYSHDDNLWGRSAEGGEIEDLEQTPPFEKFLKLCQTPQNAPDSPETMTLTFKEGLPTHLNGKKLPFEKLLPILTKLGGKHAIGIKTAIEDRIIGIKARNVFEEPAADILITAHQALEQTVSTKEESVFKGLVDQKWGDLCFSAKWFEPLMDELNAFIGTLNAKVTGEVSLTLYKGNLTVTQVKSPFSLVDQNLATFDKNDALNQNASAGFIEMYSLAGKTAHNIKNQAVQQLQKPDLRF